MAKRFWQFAMKPDRPPAGSGRGGDMNVVASGVIPALLAAFATRPVAVGRGAVWLTGGATWTVPIALAALVALARRAMAHAPKARQLATVVAGAEPVRRRGTYARGLAQFARDLARPDAPTDGGTTPLPVPDDSTLRLCAPNDPDDGSDAPRNVLAQFMFRDTAGASAPPGAGLARALAGRTDALRARLLAATFPPPDPRAPVCKTNPPLGWFALA